MPSFIDSKNPPRKGKEDTKRDIVICIVREANKDRYLTLQWKKYGWTTFITGGVEKGEDIIQAGKREIAEETGYTDLKFVRELGGPTEAFFYAEHKGVNRQTKSHILLFDLVSDVTNDIQSEEKEQFDTVWMSSEELQHANMRHAEFTLIWQRITTGVDVYTGHGVIINSEEWNGLRYPNDKEKIINDLEKKDVGHGKSTYHLRDWLISRQRYWGPPIPMIYCEHCANNKQSWFSTDEGMKRTLKNFTKKEGKLGISYSSRGTKETYDEKLFENMVGWYPVPTDNLPVELPIVKDFKPLGTGKAPLANHPEFYTVSCPHCGKDAIRETDVSDVFLDSAWYFLRYLATDLDDLPFPMNENKTGSFPQKEKHDSEKRLKWLPVTSYIGGAEHAVLHLLYSRFITMVLKDLGYIDFEEPFTKFRANGLIIKDGTKMSKSKGNVIIPDEYIKKYGADTLRTYLMFLGPFTDGGDFQDSGIEGIHKFLRRVWTLFTSRTIISNNASLNASPLLHKTIKGVTEDMEELRYNTAIAKLMTYYHELTAKETLAMIEVKIFLQMLAPFAPHMTEELWERIGETYSIHKSAWPTYNKDLIVEDIVTIAIQVNGKLRGTIAIEKDSMQDSKMVIKLARESTQVLTYLEGKDMKREPIYIPGKIVNFIV